VSTTLSPILSLFLAPSGQLYQKVQQLLAQDETTAGSNSSVVKHRRPGPKNRAYGISSEQWPAVLHRVLENHESLRTIAAEYGVSYETVRRIIRTAHKQPKRYCQPGEASNAES
jgi:hypothetical protein